MTHNRFAALIKVGAMLEPYALIFARRTDEFRLRVHIPAVPSLLVRSALKSCGLVPIIFPRSEETPIRAVCFPFAAVF